MKKIIYNKKNLKMTTIIYQNKEHRVEKIEPCTFSFGGGLETVDGEKITCENNVVFFRDVEDGKYYEEKHSNR
jgi:hypothetical protein